MEAQSFWLRFFDPQRILDKLCVAQPALKLVTVCSDPQKYFVLVYHVSLLYTVSL